MLKSAEYFLAGFFGLEWTNNATLEVIIEGSGFNNSLAGYDNCNNSNKAVAAGGTNASTEWVSTYLPNATHRFQELTENFTWNTSDIYKYVSFNLLAIEKVSVLLSRIKDGKRSSVQTPSFTAYILVFFPCHSLHPKFLRRQVFPLHLKSLVSQSCVQNKNKIKNHCCS